MSRWSAANRWSAIASSMCCCRNCRERGLFVQVVTSAVRPIPAAWAAIPRLQICVSIDGLQPEHDARRTPATYDRILKHIDGHAITVHCTVTRQQTLRDGYHRRVRAHLVGQSERAIDLAEPLHAASREQSDEKLTAARSHPRGGGDSRAARPVSKAADAAAAARRVPRSAVITRRMHLRADHRMPVGRSADAHRPMPVRRHARLRELRLHGVGGLAAVGRHRLGGVVPIDALFAGSCVSAAPFTP